jgi:hypothetical protein
MRRAWASPRSAYSTHFKMSRAASSPQWAHCQGAHAQTANLAAPPSIETLDFLDAKISREVGNADYAPTALITGASRGLGRQIVVYHFHVDPDRGLACALAA